MSEIRSGRRHVRRVVPAGNEQEHAHGGLFGEQTELVVAALCGGLLSALTDITPRMPWSLYLAAYLFGGIFMFRDAIEDICAGRFNIDFLMLVAAVGAATLGEWAEGALLLFLFSLGHSLEHFSMGRAKRAIEALAELTPQTALVRRKSKTEEVPVEHRSVMTPLGLLTGMVQAYIFSMKELPASPKWTVVEGQIDYVCCPPCTEKIAADPQKFLQQIDDLYLASLETSRVAFGSGSGLHGGKLTSRCPDFVRLFPNESLGVRFCQCSLNNRTNRNTPS